MAWFHKVSPQPAIVRLWLLRIVLGTTLCERMGDDWPDARILNALDISTGTAKKPTKLKARLERRLAQLSNDVEKKGDVVSKNVERLGERLGLGSVERSILALAVYAECDRALYNALHAFEEDDVALQEALAIALRCDAEDVGKALAVDGTLRGSKLLTQDAGYRTVVSELALGHGISRRLRKPFRDANEFLAKFFAPAAAPARLEAADFPHLAPEIDLAVRLLRATSRERTAGVNLLLYGPPGTGKTELARLFAKLAELSLFEISVSDESGDPTAGHSRLAGYALSQRGLRTTQDAAVLFDEIEDALPRRTFGYFVHRGSGDGKGWFNRTLETNPVPAIWITNSVDHIDPAYVRRFSLVIEVTEPPVRVRRRVLERALSGLGVSEAWIERQARRRGLQPAQIQTAARVVGLVRSRDEKSVEELLERSLDGVLAALGDDGKTDFSVRLDVGAFDLGYVNASHSLGEVVAGLRRSRRGSVLLSGPPGTGKTAFVAHLATELELSVTSKRVSDLQSCWLGETEKNLAAAFREARRDGTILFLDEADSFFQSRERASKQWEVSQVNELLTQMEAFEGIFVCATNLVETLDPASLRRFELKIRLEPLSREQRARLFLSTLHLLRPTSAADDGAATNGTLRSDDAWQKTLDGLAGLTPGDYAAAARRLRVLGVDADAARLVRELESERAYKPGARGTITGFRG